jgi:2-oxoisovalerate dehydrogenase E1 component
VTVQHGVDALDVAGAYRSMATIRAAEERTAELYRDGLIPGFVHLSNGQEAVPVGVCATLRADDVITSTHRGHGHVLAKGVELGSLFAELMGRVTGACGGYGGSMHIASAGARIFGANGIVGAGLPIAAGAAMSMRQQGSDRVAVAFFGDGAVSTGAFHEAVNLAALWQLPLVLVCEVNGFAEFSLTDDQHPVTFAERAAGYGIPHVRVDGNDVVAVHAATAAAVGAARSGGGPTFVEAVTRRLRGHYEGDPQRYRSDAGESDGRDPLDVAAAVLSAGGVDDAGIAAIRRSALARVDAAIEAARTAPEPDPAGIVPLVLKGDYAPAGPSTSATGEDLRVSQSLRAALADAMADDERVMLLGIDIGAGGGVFGITRGLADRFPGRVLDTPISETAIVGGAVGAALDGRVPVAELMYLDFLGVCFDQLLNQAAKLRFMTGGQVSVGLTLRTQFAIGRSSGSQHSQSLEALLAHVPGLVVVMPSSVEDHYGLLRSAIDSPDPVVFVENRLLYERRGPSAASGQRTPLGTARVARAGSDLTVVTASAATWTALDVARSLAADGIDCEIVDLRTISPWDHAAVLASVAKTGRVLTYFESAEPFGVGAEINAVVAAEGFWTLDAPPRRLAGLPAPVPYSPVLERAWLPSAERLEAEIRALAAV